MLNKKKASILAIIALVLLGGLATLRYSSALSGHSPSPEIKSSNDDEVDRDATAAVTDDVSEQDLPEKSIAVGSTFSETLKRCFPEMSGKINTPKAFVENWKSENPKFREDLDFIHYFFKDKQGKEVRGQIEYMEANGRPIRELKIFRVLEDGLPDPVEIPEDDKFNPNNTTLSKYIDFNTVFETQKKWSARITDTTHIEVEESNSEITEFQLFQDELIFRCHEGDCECKTKN